jgi:hypothetical protein
MVLIYTGKFVAKFLQIKFSWLAKKMEELPVRRVFRGRAMRSLVQYGKPGLITYLIHNR